MAKPKVLLSHPAIPDTGVQILRDQCDVVFAGPSREDILAKVRGVDAIYWCSMIPLDKEIIDAAGPGLRAVATMSAGYGHIDVALLKERGIPVSYNPRLQDNSVADVAVALVLSVARRLQEGRRALEQGKWESGHPQSMLGIDIPGSTVGIVGMGGIGQAFAKKMKAFNIGSLQYCGHSPKPAASALEAQFVSFDKLVESSDIILISCVSTPETKKMFNATVFQKMKRTAILINVARGDIIDQEALVEALKTNQIWGAGLDVMYPEPLPVNHPLVHLPNCVLFPHVGSATVGTRSAMAELAAKNIMCALQGQPMLTPIPN